MTMGWTEPPPLTHSSHSSFSDGGSPTSPFRAPTADRRLSQAFPESVYRTEAASKRFSRKFSFRPGWMDPQSSPTNSDFSHDEVMTATLATLEGKDLTAFPPTAIGQRSSIAGPSEATLDNIRRMSTVRRVSCYAPDPTVNKLVDPKNHSPLAPLFPQHAHGIFNTNVDYNKERPLPTVEIHVPGETDALPPRMSRMSHRKQSAFTDNIPEMEEGPLNESRYRQSQVDPKALSHAVAAVEGTAAPREDLLLSERGQGTAKTSRRKSTRRASQFLEVKTNIPDIREAPTIDVHNALNQPDPKALNDALAALEGAQNAQTQVSEKSETTPRRPKRASAKRVSIFVEDKIPEAGEAVPPVLLEKPPTVPAKSRHRRKPSVEYALAALEAPTPIQANMGRPRRPDPATRSRKTKSMILELGPRNESKSPKTSQPVPDGDIAETKFESTSRKLKRLSWDVMGRALPQPRSFNDFSNYSTIRENSTASIDDSGATNKKSKVLPTTQTTPPAPPMNPTPGMATSFSRDQQPHANILRERRIEPVPRRSNRTSWYSMDPAVAEIQCSPRKEYGAPPPWLEEPAVQPSLPAQAVQPGNPGESTKFKRASWLPSPAAAAGPARDIEPSPASSPLHELEVAPDTTGNVGGDEEEEQKIEDVKSRKKMNRMSRLVFSQGPKKRYTQEVFPQLSGPLNSHPHLAASSDVQEQSGNRSADIVKTPPKSRLKRFGLQLGRLFR